MNSCAPAARAAASISASVAPGPRVGDVLAHAAVQHAASPAAAGRRCRAARRARARAGRARRVVPRPPPDRRSAAACARSSTCRRPDAPTSATRSPGATRSVTPFSASSHGRVRRVVAEPDVVELDRAARAAEPAGAVHDARALVEQLDDALGAGERLEDRVGERAEVAHRAVEARQVRDEDEHPAEREPAAGDRPRAEVDDEQDPGQLDQVDERREHAADADRGQLGGDHALALAAVAVELPALAARGLHEGDVAERLLGHRAERARAAALLARRALDQAAEAARDDEEQRRDDRARPAPGPTADRTSAPTKKTIEQHGGERARPRRRARSSRSPRRRRRGASARRRAGGGRARRARGVSRCANTRVRIVSRKRSPSQVVSRSSASAIAPPSSSRPTQAAPIQSSGAELAGHEHVVDDELEEVDLGGLDRDAGGDQQPAPSGSQRRNGRASGQKSRGADDLGAGAAAPGAWREPSASPPGAATGRDRAATAAPTAAAASRCSCSCRSGRGCGCASGCCSNSPESRAGLRRRRP